MANATNASPEPANSTKASAAGRRARTEPTRAKNTSAAAATSAKGVVTARAGSAKKSARTGTAAAEPAKSSTSRSVASRTASKSAAAKPATGTAAGRAATSQAATTVGRSGSAARKTAASATEPPTTRARKATVAGTKTPAGTRTTAGTKTTTATKTTAVTRTTAGSKTAATGKVVPNGKIPAIGRTAADGSTSATRAPRSTGASAATRSTGGPAEARSTRRRTVGENPSAGSRAVAAESGTGTRVRKTIPAGDGTPPRSRAVAAETSTASRPRKTLSSDAQSGPATPPRKTIGRPADAVRPAMHAAEDREVSGGRHRRSAEPPETPTGRHRMSADDSPARHRAGQHPSHAVGEPTPSAAEAPEQPVQPPARHAQPRPERPAVDPATGLPPGMTRGILELAAERLAAARAAQPADGDGDEPEPEEPEAAEETPRPTARRTGRTTGGPGLRATNSPAAGTRPGLGSRPPLASRPPAGPPEAVRPPTTPPDTAPRRPPAGPPEAVRPPTTPPDSALRRPPAVNPTGTPDVGPRIQAGMPLGTGLFDALASGLTQEAVAAPEPMAAPTPISTRRPRGSRPAFVVPVEDEAEPIPEGPQLVRPIRAAEPEQPAEPEATDTEQPDRTTRRRPILRSVPVTQVLTEPPATTRPDFYRVPDASHTAPETSMVDVAGPALPAEVAYPRQDTAEIPRIVPEPEAEDGAWFWSTTEHPTGLPESVRLPVGIPEGLWHPAEHEPSRHDEPIQDERPTHEQPIYTAAAVVEAPGSEIAEDVTETSREAVGIPHQALPDNGVTPVVEIDRSSPPPDADGTEEIRAKLSPSRRKLLKRRRRVTFMAYLLVVSLVLIVGHELRDRQRPTVVDRAAEPIGVPAPQVDQEQEKQDQVGSAQGIPDTAAPAETSGRSEHFRYVQTRGRVLGESGKMHRFRVAVEETVQGVGPKNFSAVIDHTLGDKRSWIHSGDVRLRRVAESAETDFTIYLATAATSEKMCAEGGLHTEGFTSCRVPGQVIINAERWADGVPDYEGELDQYRQYAINHEVGHELGHGHEACPGKGKPAPVMLQQTYGLDGCTRNAWPYLDGKRYKGEPRP